MPLKDQISVFNKYVAARPHLLHRPLVKDAFLKGEILVRRKDGKDDTSEYQPIRTFTEFTNLEVKADDEKGFKEAVDGILDAKIGEVPKPAAALPKSADPITANAASPADGRPSATPAAAAATTTAGGADKKGGESGAADKRVDATANPVADPETLLGCGLIKKASTAKAAAGKPVHPDIQTADDAKTYQVAAAYAMALVSLELKKNDQAATYFRHALLIEVTMGKVDTAIRRAFVKKMEEWRVAMTATQYYQYMMSLSEQEPRRVRADIFTNFPGFLLKFDANVAFKLIDEDLHLASDDRIKIYADAFIYIAREDKEGKPDFKKMDLAAAIKKYGADKMLHLLSKVDNSRISAADKEQIIINTLLYPTDFCTPENLQAAIEKYFPGLVNRLDALIDAEFMKRDDAVLKTTDKDSVKGKALKDIAALVQPAALATTPAAGTGGAAVAASPPNAAAGGGDDAKAAAGHKKDYSKILKALGDVPADALYYRVGNFGRRNFNPFTKAKGGWDSTDAKSHNPFDGVVSVTGSMVSDVLTGYKFALLRRGYKAAATAAAPPPAAQPTAAFVANSSPPAVSGSGTGANDSKAAAAGGGGVTVSASVKDSATAAAAAASVASSATTTTATAGAAPADPAAAVSVTDAPSAGTGIAAVAAATASATSAAGTASTAVVANAPVLPTGALGGAAGQPPAQSSATLNPSAPA